MRVLNIGRIRWITQIVLSVGSIASIMLVSYVKPQLPLANQITVALGYTSLIYLGITLLIGPWQLLRNKRRRNPVNINLRRDVGIWVGITGIAHVVFGFQIHLGGDIIRYFFEKDQQGNWQLALNLFGVSNIVGLWATVVLVLLLVLSNDVSLRVMKGKIWKNLQRLNYVLAVLVIAHTIGYQNVVNREGIMTLLVISTTIVVLVFQLLGLNLYRRRQQLGSSRAKNDA
ncbi:MAG: hypothetical protein SF123_11030 [Chloroflexota bacterium]|nr:hypothetical protein [Chloroflexota bacterium]